MPSSETLKARVDAGMARKVRRWAKDHGKDTSETIRIALQRLLDEQDRARRVEAAMKEFDAIARTGVFDPPKGPWKAGGFR